MTPNRLWATFLCLIMLFSIASACAEEEEIFVPLTQSETALTDSGAVVTGTRAQVEGHVIAGKTGTAQVNSSGGKYSPHAWYVGYCDEAETPYAIAVVVENGGSGSAVAGGIAAKLLPAAAELLQTIEK